MHVLLLSYMRPTLSCIECIWSSFVCLFFFNVPSWEWNGLLWMGAMSQSIILYNFDNVCEWMCKQICQYCKGTHTLFNIVHWLSTRSYLGLHAFHAHASRIQARESPESGWELQYAIIHNCKQSFVFVLYLQHVCNVFYSNHSHCLFGDLEKCKKLVEVHCDRYAFILSIPLLWWQYIYIIRFIAYV